MGCVAVREHLRRIMSEQKPEHYEGTLNLSGEGNKAEEEDEN
jgi:hypothetical protein